MLKPEQVAQEITSMLNQYSAEGASKDFIKAMSRDHRTLQQSFTRLCLQWIEHTASEGYETDLRNEQSKVISQQLLKLFTQHGVSVSNMKPSEFLPFI